VADQEVVEGDSGKTDATFTVSLHTVNGGATASETSVGFQASAVTASPIWDFEEVSGSVTFPAGSPDGSIATFVVPVYGDTTDEPDETFRVDLTPLTAAGLSDGSARGLIRDDDGSPSAPLTGLSHGSVLRRDLAALPGPAADADWYHFPSTAPSSYEVVVDEVSGDVQPLAVDLLSGNEGAPVAQGVPVGTGGARSLRFYFADPDQKIRVRSGGCTTGCSSEDTYRIRAYDTSYVIPRFNAAGGLRTFVIVQNRTDQPVSITVWFWNEQGTSAYNAQRDLSARGSVVIQASEDTTGSIVVVHDGGYGALAGKAVTVDPLVGSSYDSVMEPRRR